MQFANEEDFTIKHALTRPQSINKSIQGATTSA